jgi:hypothetical protein
VVFSAKNAKSDHLKHSFNVNVVEIFETATNNRRILGFYSKDLNLVEFSLIQLG